MKKWMIMVLAVGLFWTCGQKDSGRSMPEIGFLDVIEDETLAEARKGFFSALRDSGYVKDSSLQVEYRNAQGDMGVLLQSVDYFVSRGVEVIATNATAATIAAVQRNRKVPVCMMVSPSPALAGLEEGGRPPGNLFGVYETLEYIDTAMALVAEIFPSARRLGAIYSESEVQSKDALERLRRAAAGLGLEVRTLPVSNSSEAQLVTEKLVGEGVDVFFALPDNVIFSSFETVVAVCDRAKVPVVTSESGLVKRGALMAFGADMYEWGYQAGSSCAVYLRSGSLPSAEKLVRRRKVYNERQAREYAIEFGKEFKAMKE